MIYVRIINSDNIFLNDDFVDELTKFTVETPIPSGMYAFPGKSPKWDGTKWVEQGSAPIFPTISEPTIDDRVSSLETLVLQLGGVI